MGGMRANRCKILLDNTNWKPYKGIKLDDGGSFFLPQYSLHLKRF
jgi:hypothetical protein